MFPIEEEIRRFRATIEGPPPEGLAADGAETRDGLVRAFVGAVERADTTALTGLLVTRAEFAALYYPYTEFTRPPYKQSPALVWFRMTNLTDQGITRVLRRHGGQPLGFRGYRCEVEPLRQEANTIWRDCVLRFTEEGLPVERRLFGTIVEREGRFKFLTYGSDY